MFLSGQNSPNVFPFFLCFTILSILFLFRPRLFFFFFFFFCQREIVESPNFSLSLSLYIYIYIYIYYLLFPAILALQGPSLLFSKVQFFFSFLFLLCNKRYLSLSFSLSCKFLKWVSFSSQILSFCFNKNPSNKKKDNSLIKYVCNKRYFILKYAIKFVTEVK